MNNMRLSTLLYVSIISLLVITILLIATVSMRSMNNLVEVAEVDSIQDLQKSAMGELSAEGNKATTMAALVAQKSSTIKALSTQDRSILDAEYVTGFASLKSTYDIRQFQFHLPLQSLFSECISRKNLETICLVFAKQYWMLIVIAVQPKD